MNKQQIDHIYDSFPSEAQDMTREQFHKEVRALLDPVKMNQDLDAIMMEKAKRRSARIRAEQINRKLNDN